MSQNKIVWQLCNSETSFQSQELDLEEAIAMAKKIPVAEREFWFAWQTGWEDWKGLLDVEEFKGHVRDVSTPPPIPPRRHQTVIVQEPVAGPQAVAPPPAAAPVVIALPPPTPEVPVIAIAPAAVPPPVSTPAPASVPPPLTPEIDPHERRKHPRYALRLRVIIRNESLSFRTFTRDISLGGFSLENPLPEKLLDDKCHVFIGNTDGSSAIRFALSPTQRQDRRYFSFSGVDPEMAARLGKWITEQVSKHPGKIAG